MNFHTIIKAIGTGPKSNRELSKNEIEFVMQSILNKTFSDIQISAFLIAWRGRRETHDEMRYAHNYLTSQIKSPIINQESTLLGYPYDGKNTNPYLMLMASKDISISLTGDCAVASKNGLSITDLYNHNLLQTNQTFVHRKDYLVGLSSISNLRSELSLRVGFNAIEKLLNPMQSKYAIVGYTHGAYKEFYKSLKHQSKLERLIVIKGGDEGSPDISKNSTAYIIDEDKEIEIKIRLDEFDIKPIKNKIKKSKQEIQTMMNTKICPKLLTLNRAILLIANKQFDNLQESFDYAKKL